VADDAMRERIVPALFALSKEIGIEADPLIELYDRVMREWKEWGRILEIDTQKASSLQQVADELPGGGAQDAEEGGEARVTDPEGAGIESKNGNAPASCCCSGEDSSQAGLRILAVDDSPLDLKLLTRLLTSSGHRVSTAPNGKEALARVLEETPQLILTDWVMPVMDGMELCKSLRRAQKGRQIYIIVLTGCEDEEHLVEAFEAGADDYVVKPFSPRTLCARIRAAERIIRLQEEVDRDKEEIRRYAAELSIANRKLERAALTDLLTGLPNRRYAMERLDQEWAGSVRHNRPLCCMIADIDHFKRVNDTYGHDVGDIVLRETAAVLKKTVRKDDVVCRFGGEEFLLICPDTPLEGAVLLANRLCAAVAAHDIRAPGFIGGVKISVGVAVRTDSMSTPHQFLKAADEALYAAKRGGRNRACAAPAVTEKTS